MSLSKSFAATMQGMSCADVFHPGEKCLDVSLGSLIKMGPYTATFFVPLVFIPILRNIKHLGWSDIKDSLYLYCCMVGTAYVAGYFTTTGWCVMRRLMGKFHFWTILFVPAFVGNVAIFLMPQKAAGYFVNSILSPVIESYFRRDNKWYWKLIGTSKTIRTAMFMAMSAVILDTSSRFRNDVFWFLQPQKHKQVVNEPTEPSPWMDLWLPIERRVCCHKGSCDEHIKSGFKTYLNVGLVLEFVRISFNSFALIKSSPLNVFSIYASKINLKLIFFLVGYATSYRTLACSVARLYQKPTKKANIVAAFLSGASYLIYPNLTILAHATAAAGKLIWLRYSLYRAGKSKLVNAVDSLPMTQLIYLVCIAYAFHIRAFYPFSTPGFIVKTTQYTSGMRFNTVTENIGSILMGLQAKQH